MYQVEDELDDDELENSLQRLGLNEEVNTGVMPTLGLSNLDDIISSDVLNYLESNTLHNVYINNLEISNDIVYRGDSIIGRLEEQQARIDYLEQYIRRLEEKENGQDNSQD